MREASSTALQYMSGLSFYCRKDGSKSLEHGRAQHSSKACSSAGCGSAQLATAGQRILHIIAQHSTAVQPSTEQKSTARYGTARQDSPRYQLGQVDSPRRINNQSRPNASFFKPTFACSSAICITIVVSHRGHACLQDNSAHINSSNLGNIGDKHRNAPCKPTGRASTSSPYDLL